MEVRRTVPVALDVDSDDAALLEDTVDTFLRSAQYVVKYLGDKPRGFTVLGQHDTRRRI